MLNVKYTNQFKKDYKLIQKRGYDIDKLMYVVELLKQGKELPFKYKDHYLTGEYRQF